MEDFPSGLRLAGKNKLKADEEGYVLVDQERFSKALEKIPKGRGKTRTFFSIGAVGERGEAIEGKIYSVTIDDINYEHMNSYVNYFVDLSARIKRNLHVHHTHAVAQAPIPVEEGTLNIFPFSSPTQLELTGAEKFADMELEDLAVDFLTPSFLGKVFGDKNGMPIAEWLGGNVWILWDFQHLPDTKGIARKVLDKIFDGSLVDVSSAFTADLEAVKRKVLSTVSQDFDKFTREREELFARQSGLEDELTGTAARILTLNSLLNDSDNAVNKLVDKTLSEIAHISTLNGVVHTKYDGETLRVFTAPIIIQHTMNDGTETIRDLGSFEIIVVSNRSINVKPVGAVVGDRAHPHIRGDHPCWGNVGRSISKLLANREYLALISFTLEFLHTFTEGDAYASLLRCGKKLEKLPKEIGSLEASFDPSEGLIASECLLAAREKESADVEEKQEHDESDQPEEGREEARDPDPA